jgi:nucleoside-diphosphate-sugar epimerase
MSSREASITTENGGLPGSDARREITPEPFLVGTGDRILVTGAAGFIGTRVVRGLVDRGYGNIGCFVRPSSDLSGLDAVIVRGAPQAQIDVLKGNLLSWSDCEAACQRATIIFHVAAGTGEKSFPDAFMNSVVSTRNLLEASLKSAVLKRFVLVSSFTVYTNSHRSRLLDESCPVEDHPELRGDAYCYAKVRQEQIMREYGDKFGIPYVIVRPGTVYGSGRGDLTGRVGIGSFGLFLHLGGGNKIPFTYVDNCAQAIILAGIVNNVEGEVFNVVDDDLPSSRTFLRSYKRNVRHFKSVYVPHSLSYALCYLWERYSKWSNGQLPPVFNRRRWRSEWKRSIYSNRKLKEMLGWRPNVSIEEGLRRYFQNCREGRRHA